MAEPRRFEVVIVGGGIAGLSLANALQAADISYVLLEARSEIAPQVGASIGIFANGARILDQLGCWDSIERQTIPLTTFGEHFANGEPIGARSDGPQLIKARTNYRATFLDRQTVLQVLYDNIKDKSRVLLNKRVERIEHAEDGVTVHCCVGASHAGDIVVGADGVFSKVRQEMWRLADKIEPTNFSHADKINLKAEYKCLFGISSPIQGLGECGRIDVTSARDLSTMTIVGKGGRVYWFLYRRLSRTFRLGEIPRFSSSDADKLAAEHADLAILPKGAVTVGDLYKNKTSSTLVSIEEAAYEHWSWGRMVCLGDSAHKMTPNGGFGGNACIESAAALTNALHKMLKSTAGSHPSSADITTALKEYQASRYARVTTMMKTANELTRIQALRSWQHRIMAYYVIPNAGDHLINMQASMSVGSTRIEFLPPPKRSMLGTMPFNPSQGFGKDERRLKRAVLALPLVAMFLLAARVMDCTMLIGLLEGPMKAKQVSWPGHTVQLKDSFYGLSRFDTTWYGPTVAFTAANFGIDGPSRWQLFSFLMDYGVLYAIFLIESARRGNALTLAQIPALIGYYAQLSGIGVLSSIYFFSFIVTSQISNYKATDSRLTSMKWTTTVLPTLILVYYVPLTGQFFAPTYTSRHNWNWIWQPFPIFASVVQQLSARTGIAPDTVKHDRIHNPRRDLTVIRYTVNTLALAAACTWLYTLTRSPYSIRDIFIPDGQLASKADLIQHVHTFLQYDHLFCFANTYLWLAYLFWDLKHAGMIREGWLRLVVYTIGLTAVVGPGATTGFAWLWREETIAFKRHKDAIVSSEQGVPEVEREKVVLNGHANGQAEQS